MLRTLITAHDVGRRRKMRTRSHLTGDIQRSVYQDARAEIRRRGGIFGCELGRHDNLALRSGGPGCYLGRTTTKSISTKPPRAPAGRTTCTVVRAGLFGWSLVPKNWGICLAS